VGWLRRVRVVGCSGAGKSVRARQLAARTGLPVIGLDSLAWPTCVALAVVRLPGGERYGGGWRRLAAEAAGRG